jgi:hypothetical protein
MRTRDGTMIQTMQLVVAFEHLNNDVGDRPEEPQDIVVQVGRSGEQVTGRPGC